MFSSSVSLCGIGWIFMQCLICFLLKFSQILSYFSPFFVVHRYVASRGNVCPAAGRDGTVVRQQPGTDATAIPAIAGPASPARPPSPSAAGRRVDAEQHFFIFRWIGRMTGGGGLQGTVQQYQRQRNRNERWCRCEQQQQQHRPQQLPEQQQLVVWSIEEGNCLLHLC